jgi:hypothetical protein
VSVYPDGVSDRDINEAFDVGTFYDEDGNEVDEDGDLIEEPDYEEIAAERALRRAEAAAEERGGHW